MQPLGRTKIRFPGKTDHHPGKGYKNWWEGEVPPNKAAARQTARSEIATGLDEYYQEKYERTG